MNRRSFFKGLLAAVGILAVPRAAKALPIWDLQKSQVNVEGLLAYRAYLIGRIKKGDCRAVPRLLALEDMIVVLKKRGSWPDGAEHVTDTGVYRFAYAGPKVGYPRRCARDMAVKIPGWLKEGKAAQVRRT